MEHLKIQKANFSKIDPEKVWKKYTEYIEKKSGKNFVFHLSEPDYLHWEKIKHKEPPSGFSNIETWYVVREVRKFASVETYLKAENGSNFTFLKSLALSDELLHRIDVGTGGGGMFAPYQIVSDQKNQNFLTRGIIEEAIASSQLEGANTTRKAARLMILQKRKPRNPSERMIINNYKTMQAIEQDFKNRKMDIDLLFEMHRILTEEDSNIKASERGRLRTDKDDIVVYNRDKAKCVHVPPKQKFLESEIERLITYANNEDSQSFTHPIIKAIFLHFWIGYLHPFTDGNGRMARAIFYWYLLREGYWMMMFLPISTVIKKSRDQYDKAYLYVEQDGFDLTYFYSYQLKKIIQALEEFKVYVAKRINENKEIDRMVSSKDKLNDRQKNSLHFLQSKGEFTTTKTHMTIYRVSRLTAYNDLSKLVKLGYLNARKNGKELQYFLSN